MASSFILLDCAPSEAEVRADFNAYLAGASACEAASDCTLIFPGCPLGCFAAVRADRKAEAERKARDLIDDYQSGGAKCVYDCAVPGPVECRENRCSVSAQ